MTHDDVNLWLRGKNDRIGASPPSVEGRAGEGGWILADVCAAIEANGGLELVVDVFGPIETDAVDAALTLEQLGSVAKAIDEGETSYEISFIQSGLATTLFFDEDGDDVRILRFDEGRDEHRLTYLPWWATRAMLRDLLQTFVFLAESRCPELAASDAFHDWLSSVGPLLRSRKELRSLCEEAA